MPSFQDFATGLAGARDGVSAPCLLPGIEIRGVDPTANAEFAPGRADDGDIAHDQRRESYRLADRRLGHLALPHHFAGRSVERENAAVERDRDHLVLPKGDPAIVYAAAGDIAGPSAIDPGIELPFDVALFSARHVDCIDRAPAVGKIHHPIIDEGRCFEIALGVAPAGLQATETDGEGEAQIAYRAGVDFLER